MGGGPIDFKFSHGYRARVLVEMKRSSGQVRHCYERQLDIYLDASQSNPQYVTVRFSKRTGKDGEITYPIYGFELSEPLD